MVKSFLGFIPKRNMYSLGDMRKFSPKIMAFIRKCLGGNIDTVDSFSGKTADVWAAGLYIWELLEDNIDNLFSVQRGISLKTRAAIYSAGHFEDLVENINSLKGSYSSTLLNLLRQVLTVDPELRAKTSHVIKKLSQSAMNESTRKETFEELIKLSNKSSSSVDEELTATQIPIYPLTDLTLYVSQQSPVYIPKDLYANN